MAICATCGQDNPDGDWSCRTCGTSLGRSNAAPPPGSYEEPVYDRDYYEAPTTYGTSAPTIRPLESKSAWDRKSKLTALAVGTIVVLAILGSVWFFFLRPPGGEQFIGTWKGVVPIENGRQGGLATISRHGRAFELMLVDDKGKRFGPFAAELSGDRLATSLKYVGSNETQKLASKILTQLIASMVDDFRIVYFFRGGTLYVTATGRPHKGLSAAGLGDTYALQKAK
jgi:hypothetical protein